MQSDSEQTPHARCGAKTRSGRPCSNYPVSDRNRCRMHGGKTPHKHGLYAKTGPPPRLADKIEAYQRDPKILDHQHIGAHLMAVLDDLLSQVKPDEAATPEQAEALIPVYRELQKTATNFHRLAIDKRFVDLVEAGPMLAQWVERMLRFVPEERRKDALSELENLIGDVPGAQASIH